jgi:hypothetical protein
MRSNRLLGACTKVQAKVQVAGTRQCYLQFDYAKFRNSGIRKGLCYIQKLERSLDIQP